MEFESLLQAITTVGFPIVMCLVLLWYINKMVDSHKEETKAFTDALNKNTTVLERVCDKLNIESEVE